MKHNSTRHIGRILAAMGIASLLVACDSDNDEIINQPPPLSRYAVTNLVADLNGAGATTIDPNLVNPWGVAFGPTGTLWVANEGTGTSTLYDVNGVAQSLVVTIPSAISATGGKPTGTVFNPTADFVIPGGGKANFLFAGMDGTIAAWSAGTSAQIVIDRSAQDAVYLGVAIASDGVSNFLYAANFKNNSIDVFDANFQFVKSFTDPSIPAGFGPFNIQQMFGVLFVTYAKQQAAPNNGLQQIGPGLGFVDAFNPSGTAYMRFASNGNLNAPWGMAVAPDGFGSLSGAVLIGNFGDGRILAFDPFTGEFIDFLRDATDAPIVLSGLWGLTFGPVQQPASLFFAAGIDGQTHGLVGKITLVP